MSLKGNKGDKGDQGNTGVATHITLGDYQYHAASSGVDTANDWRIYADGNGLYIQFCTVGNATKGAGTWVTKLEVKV